MTSRARRAALALVLAASVSACDESSVAPAARPADPTASLSTGIHAVLVETRPGPTTAYVSLQLRTVGMAARVAGYQGELAFDASKLELTGADFPEGAEGAWQLAAPGVVRFAGAAPGGLDAAGDALRLRYIRKDAVGEAAFTLKVEEMVGGGGLEDLLPLYSGRASPVFVPAEP